MLTLDTAGIGEGVDGGRVGVDIGGDVGAGCGNRKFTLSM